MARIKISKVAKDLNVSVATVVEALRKKNITVPTTTLISVWRRLRQTFCTVSSRSTKIRRTNLNNSPHSAIRNASPITTHHRRRLQPRLKRPKPRR